MVRNLSLSRLAEKDRSSYGHQLSPARANIDSQAKCHSNGVLLLGRKLGHVRTHIKDAGQPRMVSNMISILLYSRIWWPHNALFPLLLRIPLSGFASNKLLFKFDLNRLVLKYSILIITTA